MEEPTEIDAAGPNNNKFVISTDPVSTDTVREAVVELRVAVALLDQAVQNLSATTVRRRIQNLFALGELCVLVRSGRWQLTKKNRSPRPRVFARKSSFHAGQWLKQRIAATGESQLKFALHFGFDAKTLSNWFKQRRLRIQGKSLAKLAAAFLMSLDEFDAAISGACPERGRKGAK